MRYKGGGYKKKVSVSLTSRETKAGIPADCKASIEYDPNRTAFIALLKLSRW